MTYLSVDRYRAMAYGHDLDAFDDADLAQIIARASAVVDMWCACPQLPQPFKFFGGSVTREQHRWTLGTDLVHGTRRIYPTHRPIQAVSQFRIRVTNQLSVTISGNDMFINNADGYVELVSLAAVSYGIYPVGIVPNLGLHTPVAELTYTYGYMFPVVGEMLYATDGKLFRSVGNYWSADPPPVIYVNGAEKTSGFVIDYPDGTVYFDAAPSGIVRADYTYTLPIPVAQATGEIVTDILGERDLTAKGMRGLAGVQIAEMNIRRSLHGTNVDASLAANVPEMAQLLLAPYRFLSVQ
jgi:hypothetical protein